MPASAEAWNELKAYYASHDQSHVFEYFDELTEQQRDLLFADLKAIDLKHVCGNFALLSKQEAARKSEVITEFRNTTVAADLSADKRAALRDAGLKLIASGKACAILMAGGQGTRLGSDRPKGCFDIGLPSHKSLFQLQAERIQTLKRLAAAAAGIAESKVSFPWYVMTSPQTDAETKKFFAAHNNWGLPSGDIMYFEQGNMPCLTPAGKIILESQHAVSQAPNGNGGVYVALKASGCLADMNKRGVLYAHFYGVDNALVKVGDPSFLAFCVEQKAECGNKVVLKRDWSEKVGVMCLRDGKSSVIEYSEISSAQAQAVNPTTGRLQYGAANIVQHFFTTAFLQRIADDPFALPFHTASKRIGCVDPRTGATHTPDRENGIKLEMFVFDSFASANVCVAYAVPRDGEFTAVKNATAPGVLDTPATARLDVSAYHTQLLAAAGASVTPGPAHTAKLNALVEALAVLAAKPSPAAAASAAAIASAATTAGATGADAKSGGAVSGAVSVSGAAQAAALAANELTLLELNPLLTYDGEGLGAFRGHVLVTPLHVAHAPLPLPAPAPAAAAAK